MTERVNVSMKMLDTTFNRAKELTKLLGARNMADTVGRVVDIATVVVEAMKQGKKVVFEDEDGNREKLVISGV